MADSTLSPNMNLPVPTVGEAPGPTWAQLIDVCLALVDAHTHASGSGVQITPDGINIISDLSFKNTANAISIRSIRFNPQASPIAASGVDIGCLYEAGVDLYYNDGTGNQIRITQSGSVAGASGTVTGLPSGTASAAYASGSGTFVFLQATSTAANLDIGSIAIRYPGSYPTPSGNYIQLQAPSSLSSGFALTLPASTPISSAALITSDTSGVISYTYQVSTSQIKDEAVTPQKLAALGQQISASSGTFVTSSTSFVDVTNLTVTIETTGRPVFIGIVSDGSASASTIEPSISGSIATALLRLMENSTEISRVQYRTSSATTSLCGYGAGGFFHFYAPAAGTYVYKIQALSSSSSGLVSLKFLRLVAFPL